MRSMPTATPEEVVEAAKKAGLKLDLDRVAKVRDYDLARARLKAKKEAGKVQAGKVPEKPRAAAAPKAPKKAKAAKKVAKKIAASPSKNAETTKSAKAMTKADYVRSFGPDTMPAEIMKHAAKDGVKLTVGYVYNLRKIGKKKGTKKVPTAPAAPRKRGPGRPPKAASAPAAKAAQGLKTAKAAPKARPSTDEATFRAAVSVFAVEYGLVATRAIVEDVGDRIRAAGAV